MLMNPSAAPGESTDYSDPFDDVFGSAPASPTLHASSINGSSPLEQRLQAADPSDIPRLRSIHVTNGYREGIAASKEKYIQEGFDEGYALGAEVGLLAGWCLGALEGLGHALPRDIEQGPAPSGEGLATRDTVDGLLLEASAELSVQSLLGRDYFGSDGIWSYEVPGSEAEGDITFRTVARAHPVIKKWRVTIEDLANAAGLDLGSSEGAVSARVTGT